jgi:hypothetical protein
MLGNVVVVTVQIGSAKSQEREFEPVFSTTTLPWQIVVSDTLTAGVSLTIIRIVSINVGQLLIESMASMKIRDSPELVGVTFTILPIPEAGIPVDELLLVQDIPYVPVSVAIGKEKKTLVQVV